MGTACPMAIAHPVLLLCIVLSPGSEEAAPAAGSRASPVPLQGADRLIQHFNCPVYWVHFQKHVVPKQNRVI